jgi:hypothetical protein
MFGNCYIDFTLLSEISVCHSDEYEDGCPGLLHCVVWLKFTDISEVLDPDDGGSKHL